MRAIKHLRVPVRLLRTRLQSQRELARDPRGLVVLQAGGAASAARLRLVRARVLANARRAHPSAG